MAKAFLKWGPISNGQIPSPTTHIFSLSTRDMSYLCERQAHGSMQKLKPRAMGLKPTQIGHVDEVIA